MGRAIDPPGDRCGPRQPELNHWTGKQGSDQSTGPYGTSQQEAHDEEKDVTAHADPAELEPAQLVRENDSHQIIGTCAGVAVDDQRHTCCQDHTARHHTQAPRSSGPAAR